MEFLFLSILPLHHTRAVTPGSSAPEADALTNRPAWWCESEDRLPCPVTYREAKTLLHSRYNGDWKKENGGYQAHLDPIWRLWRAQQTTIFRLRTGHRGLSAHLKRIGISDTSLCECGQADQTPDHVLQSCPKYAERRQLTRPQGADLATQLWGSAEDLYRTAGFVASTELKI